jgi:hypothetical protein
MVAGALVGQHAMNRHDAAHLLTFVAHRRPTGAFGCGRMGLLGAALRAQPPLDVLTDLTSDLACCLLNLLESSLLVRQLFLQLAAHLLKQPSNQGVPFRSRLARHW